VGGRQDRPLVCALGDLLLDVIVRLERPLAAGSDVPAETHVGAGGQAANVAAWAAVLGGRGRYVGKRAADAAGATVAAELERHGVELCGPLVDGVTGVVVSLVDAAGERTMASDRGIAPGLSGEEVEPAWLEGCQTLHVSGYALARQPIGDAAERAAALARERGVQVSADVSAATLVDDRFRARLARVRPDVLFANEDERAALGGELPAPTWVLKRGRNGCSFSYDGSLVELPASEVEVVDSTGAGDALAAGFLLGGQLDEAARRAMDAAARCVSKLGSLP
jgi:sugar/nucleoside kinase (ribokinase family)